MSVECCLQERSWNPYYAHLLQRVVASSKAHRITLRYCLWDQFKLIEQTDMRRLVNLAHLTGHLIATFALPLSSLKVSHTCMQECMRSFCLQWPAPQVRLCHTIHVLVKVRVSWCALISRLVAPSVCGACCIVHYQGVYHSVYCHS